jgi:predicted Zn-dependent protease
VQFYPASQPAKILLARIYGEGGNIGEAFKIIDSLDQENRDVISLRNSLIAASSADVGALEKQLGADTKNPVLLGRLCILTRTNPQKSLEYCRRASEAEPGNIGHAIGFGAALVQAKELVQAVDLLRKLLMLDPENYAIHANLATALFGLRRYQEAKPEFEWLIQKKPELAIAYYYLAIAHDNLAEYTDAMTNYRLFLRFVDSKQNQLEIDKVDLRIPTLEKQVKNGEGLKKGKRP